MKCLDCGNTWKEFCGIGKISEKTERRNSEIEKLRNYARKREFSNPSSFAFATNTPTANQNSSSTGKPIYGQLIAFALFLGGGIVGTTWYLTQDTVITSEFGVQLGNVRIKEQINGSGIKIITVRGDVENKSAKSARIPSISIILRRTDGKEIVRWRHNSTRPILKAGGKSGFASSIQYDTPAIAYAEAVFE